MIVEKSSTFENSNIYSQLEQAANHIENIKTKIQERKEFNAEEIKQLLPVLESCNQSLTITNRKLTPDQELDKSVDRLLRLLDSFQFINERATKDKINALQINLFANIVLQLDHLEQALKHWKEQSHKVQKTSQSNQS